MGPVLALDIGGKRTGLAISDPAAIFSFPLFTIETQLLKPELEKLMAEKKIVAFVAGMPKNLKNEATDNTAKVLHTLELLQKWFPGIPIFTVDERFTSKIAQQAHIMGGMKKMHRRQKEYTDTTSATLILQSYLEQKERLTPFGQKS